MMVMRTFKRRGNATQLKALRYSKEQEATSLVPMDGVAVLRKVMERNSSLLPEADASIQNRVWLYRGDSNRVGRRISVLHTRSLFVGIRALIERHDLLGDNGKLLAISTQRLRKTMENRLWLMSNGDLLSVATVMGHTPEVADIHYLQLSDAMKAEAAQFVGTALPAILRGDGTAEEHIPATLQKTLEKTPAGRCSDTLHGRWAPQDGVSHCERFTNCLGCPNFVVVGSVKDLHRLFSFQMFLRSDIEYMKADDMREWRELRVQQIALIDKFTAEKFPATIVLQAREAAKTSPHPFWAARLAIWENRYAN
jgi:hypothetical protein